MEPVEGAVGRIVYTIKTRVCNIEQRFRREWMSGSGAESIFRTISLGWYIHLEGSREALYLGEERPNYQTGDKIEIVIRKIEDAKPKTAPIEQVR